MHGDRPAMETHMRIVILICLLAKRNQTHVFLSKEKKNRILMKIRRR